ncbi:MAG: riboflavin synthase [Lentisphaerae bacterium]|nr:riboflavin synthase [Lentisphaerota bacterium]
MFTGLIQQIGQLTAMHNRAEGALLQIQAAWQPALEPGESVAVNGVCLTVTDISATGFHCDVLRETLDRTNLGRKKPGAALNLERALRLNDPLGGHMVTGHVDGTGVIRECRIIGQDLALRIACSSDLLQGIVTKGSIAVDGASLTVASLDSESFTIHLIPFTRAHTATWTAGAVVNLETDIIGKYVQRFLQHSAPAAGLTWDKLRQAGFMSD